MVPFDVLEVVQNGLVIAKAPASGSPASASIEIEAPIVESSWLTLRCIGQAQVYHGPANQRIFAHTSPVYVDVPGKPFRADPAVAQRFAKKIERMIAWCQTKAQCPTPQARERLTAGFVKGLERLRQMCH